VELPDFLLNHPEIWEPIYRQNLSKRYRLHYHRSVK
jgi:hypothetical protein